MKYSILVGQSGGPTSVINASLAGIVIEGLKNEHIDKVYGTLNGIDGIINHNIIDFSYEDKETLELLKTTPSSILGSVRYKLSDFNIDDTDYKIIASIFKKLNIKCFFYIGGNDSMDTCNKIHKYFTKINFDCRVIGIPKTIDNDLILTDHTPGYGSSIKYISTVMAEISEDIVCYKKGKVTIVEIMGRDAGWLTAGSKLACLANNGPDLIYLPEVAFDINNFLDIIKDIYNKKGNVLVAVSEGIKDSDGKYILSYQSNNSTDNFGHLQLGGVSQVLTSIVHERLNLPTRNIELNLPQRCASHLASLTDIEEAYNCGKYGLLYAIEGQSGKMISMVRSNDNYSIEYKTADLEQVANQIKVVPNNYISENKNNITDEFVKYALPLIQNEAPIKFENGIPKFAKLKKHIVKF